MKLPTVHEDPMEVNKGVEDQNRLCRILELGLQISIWHAYFSRNLNFRIAYRLRMKSLFQVSETILHEGTLECAEVQDIACLVFFPPRNTSTEED
jgi:hypothetical protein